MFKKNIALYLIFTANTVYAVRHGFTWPYWVAAALTAIVFVLDLREALKRGREKD